MSPVRTLCSERMFHCQLGTEKMFTCHTDVWTICCAGDDQQETRERSDDDDGGGAHGW